MRSQLRPLLFLIAVSGLIATVGCFQQEVGIDLTADGTGTVTLSVLFADPALEQARKRAADGGEAAVDPVTQADELANNTFPDVWKVKVAPHQQDGFSGVRLTATFRHAESLQEVLNGLLTAGSTMGTGDSRAAATFQNFRVVTSGEDHENWTLACSVKIPASAASSIAVEMEEAMANAKIVLSITMPDILDATCTQTSGGSMTIGRVVGNTATFEFGLKAIAENGPAGVKTFDIQVVGSTKGGLPMYLLITIALLGVVVLVTLFVAITKK